MAGALRAHTAKGNIHLQPAAGQGRHRLPSTNQCNLIGAGAGKPCIGVARKAQRGPARRAVRHHRPLRQRHRPVGGNPQRLDERRPGRADLHREVVIPRQPHFRPSRKAGLEQQACRICRRRLVQFQLMPAPGVVEQGRRRRNRKPVHRIGRRVYPHLGKALRQISLCHPARTGKDDAGAVCQNLCPPAGQGRKEDPAFQVKDRDCAILSGPGACRPRRHDMAVAHCRRARGGSARAVQNGKLHDHVQSAQRLVMGHVLLCLGRLNIGQGKNG